MDKKKDYSFGTVNMYPGSDYGFDSEYGQEFMVNLNPQYQVESSQFGVTTDPRTSNQLREVSSKLGTGAKTIEVTGITPAELESIPNHHFKELNRLAKLTGADLTFHGPLVEPTGVSRKGWNDTHRQQAERQMWSAVERAQAMDPDGNLVVTFHSSNGLPEPMTKTINDETGREELKEFWVVDESSGDFQPLNPKKDYFKGKEGEYKTADDQVKAMEAAIEKQNKDAWFRQLQHTSFNAGAGSRDIRQMLGRVINEDGEVIGEDKKKEKLAVYKDFIEGKKTAKLIEALDLPHKEQTQKFLDQMVHADNYLRDAYQELQNLFNQAYDVSKNNGNKEDIQKLDKFRAEMKPHLEYLEDPGEIDKFADKIVQGVNVLRTIRPPQTLKPLRPFAIDKAAETFSNLALNSYKKFKNNAPIMSIENPPVGMGLSKGEDLKDLVNASRKKLEKKLVEKQHMSQSSAEKQAEKLIGVTWDVGHINMLKKYGYKDEHIIKETKEVAEMAKHVHLSDNFGMEHTELPMGMGNVPTKPMLEAIGEYNKKLKKIIETGGPWYRDFQISPLKETFRAFGSPLYSMQMGPTWSQAANNSQGYFSGYGQMLPEQHFNIYGAGFGTLPPELGGQMSGTSRASGAPIQ